MLRFAPLRKLFFSLAGEGEYAQDSVMLETRYPTVPTIIYDG
jgi:hypothetical protein